MPYTITTTDPQHICLSTPERCQVEPIISRHAVATLEKAKSHIADVLDRHGSGGQPWTWPIKDGGTIGPLPDGTVIEIRRVRDHELAKLAGIQLPSHLSEIIASYNEAQ